MDDDFPNPFDDAVDAKAVVVDDGKDPALTDDNKKFLDANWKTMDLAEMTRTVFKDDTLRGNSKEGRVISQYLLTKGFQYKTTAKPKRENIELTEQNKEFIINYAKDMKPYEMARVIFKDEQLHQFSKEALTQEGRRVYRPRLRAATHVQDHA